MSGRRKLIFLGPAPSGTPVASLIIAPSLNGAARSVEQNFQAGWPPPRLTLSVARAKQRVVFPIADTFYARRRVAFARATALFERAGQPDGPSERALQSIWQHQRLRRDELKTAEGQSVRVLHPGFISVEGGPDFRGAVLQLGGEPPRTGDVEIDLRTSGWHAHGHDRNPAFKNVILQVLWDEPTRTTTTPPGLVLKDYLDAPLDELTLSLENLSLRTLPEELRGHCCAPLRALPEEKLLALLQVAARVRWQSKSAQLLARARQAGWEQALWEGMFRALGYKHNVWPLQNLAELRSRWQPGAANGFALQARLLGISALLPDELTRRQKSTDNYLRTVWDQWWRDRDTFADCQLPRSVWKFHGLRPANHPERRLALAAHWLAGGHLLAQLEQWCVADLPDDKLVPSLRKILVGPPDDFWSYHWTLRSPKLKTPQPLLGEARVTDLAVNVILPWLWVRAVEGKNAVLRDRLERRYFAWPPAEDNAVLKLARQRLLGVGGNQFMRNAFAQQGLLQIVRDFCGNSDAICTACRFPELVREWGAGK